MGNSCRYQSRCCPGYLPHGRKAARGEHAKSSLNHLHLRTIYNTRRFQKRTSTSHDHSMFRYSYKMTENTDGFFETYTCCFFKKLSLRHGVEQRDEESCCYWSHSQFLQHVRSPAGRVVKLSVLACNLHSASWLYALYVLVGRKPFFPPKPLQRPRAEDGPPKKDSSLCAHA